nr:translation initiation factor IF-2-like [Symphalangus syndactylus]
MAARAEKPEPHPRTSSCPPFGRSHPRARPGCPAPSFRPRVRPSGGTRPAPLSGGASRRLLPLAGPSLSARSGEVCTSSPRTGARAKSEMQPPMEEPAGRPQGSAGGAGAGGTLPSACGRPQSCQKHEWEAAAERTPGMQGTLG